MGPVWTGGDRGEADVLRACYVNSLAIAAEKGFGTVAFPAISTGIYRYPARAAAGIAVRTTLEILELRDRPAEVLVCCFDEAMAEVYREALTAARDQPTEARSSP